MIPGNDWQVGVRNVVSGETIWHEVIGFMMTVLSTREGVSPVPAVLYEDDSGRLAMALGGSEIRRKPREITNRTGLV